MIQAQRSNGVLAAEIDFITNPAGRVKIIGHLDEDFGFLLAGGEIAGVGIVFMLGGYRRVAGTAAGDDLPAVGKDPGGGAVLIQVIFIP